MREKAKAKIMYKILNKIGPASLTNLFTYKNKVTNTNFGTFPVVLCLPQPRTNNMKDSFLYDGPHPTSSAGHTAHNEYARSQVEI